MTRDLLKCVKCSKEDKGFTLDKRCRACYHKNYRTYNPNYLKYQRAYLRKRKLEIMQIYGGTPPHCACCGENTYEFLCLDHINGGGHKQRSEIGAGYKFYLWLKRNNYPKGIQVLCHNCNMAKSAFGECPHKRRLICNMCETDLTIIRSHDCPISIKQLMNI